MRMIQEEDPDDLLLSELLADEHDRSDYYSITLERLRNKDPSLQRLEFFHGMVWDLRRWRDENYTVNVEAWLQSIANLLHLAQENPQVVQLEFSDLPISRSLPLQKSIFDLLHCDSREWSQVTIEGSPGFDLRWLDNVSFRTLRLTVPQLPPASYAVLARCNFYEFQMAERIDRTLAFHLSEFFSSPQNTIQRVGLAASQFANDSAVDALCRGLRSKNLLLNSFSLCYCNLTNQQMTRLLGAIRVHNEITWLDVSHNHLGIEACIALVFFLANATQLVGLVINACRIDDSSLQILQEALFSCKNLTHLHLGDNEVSDNGMETLAARLSVESSIRTFWISGIHCTKKGTSAILSAVRSNPNLHQVAGDIYPLDLYRDIQYETMLNRGGRKAIVHGTRIPIGLWPKILERAQNVHCSCRHADVKDVLYYLVRNSVLGK